VKSQPLLTTAVYTSVTQIPQAQWDALFSPAPDGYYFFKTIEETLKDQFQPYYLTLYKNGEIACIAPCFTMNYSLATTVDGPFKKVLDRLGSTVTKFLTLRVLICGCPTAEGRIGIKDQLDREIVELLAGRMFTLAKEKKAGLVAFKEFSPQYDPLFSLLRKSGFHKMSSYPAAMLEINFNNFEDYLSSLSKVTRKNLRKKFRQAGELAKVEMETVNSLNENLDEVYTLYLNTLNKSGVQFEILTKDFFKKISQNMPGETRYFLWRINGKLAAFDLCLVSGGTLIDEYIGMDYTLAYQYHLYYVTFRDVFNWCLQNNVKTIQGGSLNYDPKKRLDFVFVPQSIFLKHKNSFLNFFFGILCKILQPDNFDPVLKAAKKTKNGFFWKIFTLIFFADLAEAAADLFFKKGTSATGITNVTLHNLAPFTEHLLTSPLLWIGIAFYFVNFLFWITALSKVDLSVAFPIGSTTYVIVPLLAMIFLGERVIWSQWLGIILIIVGIFFVSQSKEQVTAKQDIEE
jgi:predicted N-acyltransferase/multidrug transporter EmrE-like cation transporter